MSPCKERDIQGDTVGLRHGWVDFFLSLPDPAEKGKNLVVQLVGNGMVKSKPISTQPYLKPAVSPCMERVTWLYTANLRLGWVEFCFGCTLSVPAEYGKI